jgi:predicted GNAT family acetyltransferase
MSQGTTGVEVRHQPEASRFVTTVDGQEGFVEYAEGEGTLTITHTIVPPAIGGRGIAGQLVRAALEHARANGLKVVPRCSYAADYVQRHPEYADLLA